MARSVTGKGQDAMTSQCVEPVSATLMQPPWAWVWTSLLCQARLALLLSWSLPRDLCLCQDCPPAPSKYIMIPSSWQRSGWSCQDSTFFGPLSCDLATWMLHFQTGRTATEFNPSGVLSLKAPLACRELGKVIPSPVWVWLGMLGTR